LIWGELRSGNSVAAEGPIFPRIQPASEPVTETPAPSACVKPDETHAEETPLITIEDFSKIQLKVGTVTAAEKHPKADKLLKLKVDIGEAEPRQIIAGIAAVYPPELLVGRQIVIVANLTPAKLRGELSQGMLLAADMGENSMSLLSPDKNAPNGSKVR